MADEAKTPDAPIPTTAPKAAKAAPVLPEYEVSFTVGGAIVRTKARAETPSEALKLARKQYEAELEKAREEAAKP